jgi:hypothetical protein
LRSLLVQNCMNSFIFCTFLSMNPYIFCVWIYIFHEFTHLFVYEFHIVWNHTFKNQINKIECSHHEIIIIALTTMTYRQHILFDQQWSSQRQWQRQRRLGIIICCCCVTVCYRRGRSRNCVSFILHPLWIEPRQRWWHRRWWQWPSQGDVSVSIGETTARLFFHHCIYLASTDPTNIILWQEEPEIRDWGTTSTFLLLCVT